MKNANLRQQSLLWFPFVFSALFGTFLDLVSKSIIFKKLSTFESGRHDLITGILGFKLTYNTSIIWGLFGGKGPFIVYIVAVLLIITIWLLIKEPHWLISLGLGLILAGTLGNLYDRLTCAAVRDFIDFYLINWPIFNLADIWITIGVILIVMRMLFNRQRASKTTGILPIL